MLQRVGPMYDHVIRATDGNVGELHDLLFDERNWAIQYLVVETDGGFFGGRRVLISPKSLSQPLWDDETLLLDLTREQVKNSPPIDLDEPVSQQQLRDLHTYYGWPWIGSPLLFPTPAYLPGASLPPTAELAEAEGKDRANPYLRSTREVQGYHIQARDGEIGHVEDFFVGGIDWIIRYLLVDTSNWWFGKHVLVAPTWVKEISWAEGEVVVDLKQKSIKKSPEYNPDERLDRDYERVLHRHYGLSAYWQTEVSDDV